MIKKIITGDLGVNTYLYNYKDSLIVIIDPGSDSDKIINTIRDNSFEPRAILLTHGHFDHIGAIKDLKDIYNVPVYIHNEDSDFLGTNSKKRHLEMFNSMGPNGNFYFEKYFIENKEPEFIIRDNEILKEFNLKVIHTPGHSPGSCCFYSEKDSIIFTGDTMFCGGMGRTDFPGGDYYTILKSLEKIKTLPKETVVYPGHGGKSTISRET